MDSNGGESKACAGWTILGPADRAMDLHLQLLADEATDALSRVRDTERLKSTMDRMTQRWSGKLRL